VPQDTLEKLALSVKKIAVSLALATLTAAFFIIFVVARTPYLVLTNGHTGAVLLRRSVSEGKQFSVGYIHSVNKSPVSEIYQIRQGQIVLIAVEFETFGAGMPTEPEFDQTLSILPGGGMRIDGFDRVIDSLSYMIGHTTEHTLILSDEQIALLTLDSAGQPVRFFVKRG
jgi:hypothetical protein